MRRSFIPAFLVIGAILLSLGLLELGCRAWRGPAALADWSNLVWKARVLDGPCGHEDDPLLGWVPCRGLRWPGYNFDAGGFRATPPLPEDAAGQPPILATGDSFTEGDEVADDETYPAYLERLMGRRVINAGVSGYGLDQIVLRTEMLAAELKPAAIVVGFVPDDLRRAEMSVQWSKRKPYFELLGDRLELRGVPVPPSPRPQDTLSFWQHAFGWSVLLDTVMNRLGQHEYWRYDNRRALPPGAGQQLACPLMRRLAGLPQPVLVVAQYDAWTWRWGAAWTRAQHAQAEAVLRCAAEAGLATLDTFGAVERAGAVGLYREVHLAPQGNRLIAGLIAAALQRR